jgi:hypothetical protein
MKRLSHHHLPNERLGPTVRAVPSLRKAATDNVILETEHPALVFGEHPIQHASGRNLLDLRIFTDRHARSGARSSRFRKMEDSCLTCNARHLENLRQELMMKGTPNENRRDSKRGTASRSKKQRSRA